MESSQRPLTVTLLTLASTWQMAQKPTYIDFLSDVDYSIDQHLTLLIIDAKS